MVYALNMPLSDRLLVLIFTPTSRIPVKEFLFKVISRSTRNPIILIDASAVIFLITLQLSKSMIYLNIAQM